MMHVKDNDLKISQRDKKPFVLSGGKFLGIYLLFIIPSLFISQFISAISNKFPWLDHMSISLLETANLSIIVMLLTVWGVMNSNDERRLLPHCRTVLPVVVMGLAIWLMCWKDSEGYESWFFYIVYAMWAMPLMDYLRMSTYASYKTLAVIGLAASFIPGAFYLVGVWLRRCYPTSERKKLVKSLMLIPSFFLIVAATSIVLPRDNVFTTDAYPRIDGATMAKPFGGILARELTGINAWQAARKSQFQTTHQAYMNLIDQKVDLIFVLAPSDEEIKRAADKGVRLRLMPIGKDAFVFMVHRQSPINNLTITQIQDIYSGKIDNWQAVGGPDDSIIAYHREKNSGSQTYMENNVMKEEKIVTAPMKTVLPFMSGIIGAVANNKGAQKSIGYSFYYYASEMNRNEDIKFLSVGGIECNKENIKNDAYPFTAVIYAVTRADEPSDSSATKLLNWLSTERGKRAIEKGGFVPIDSVLSARTEEEIMLW